MKSILDNRPALRAEVEKVAEVAGYLWQKGWAERNGGNITVNVTALVDDAIRQMPAIGSVTPIGLTLPHLKGCYFYCKGTNMRMRDLARWPMQNGSIIRILPDCASYEMIADNPVRPTSELPSHLAVHDYLLAKGSPYRASVHTHPIELVALTHSQKWMKKDVATRMLWSMIPEEVDEEGRRHPHALVHDSRDEGFLSAWTGHGALHAAWKQRTGRRHNPHHR